MEDKKRDCVRAWRPFGKFVISFRSIKGWCFKDKYYFWATHQLYCSMCKWLMRECVWKCSHCGLLCCKTSSEMLLNLHREFRSDSAQLNIKVPPSHLPWKVKASWLNHQQTWDRKCRFRHCKSNLRSAVYICWCHNRDESQQCFSKVLLQEKIFS